MSSLSFENIDRWLFEYTEGNLSSEQVNQLEQFLSQHPELQLELDAWKSSKVSSQTDAYAHLASLQKSFNVWPLVSTVLLALLGVGAFFYLYDFSSEIRYAQKSIDLEVISDGDDYVFVGISKGLTDHNEISTTNLSLEGLVVEEDSNFEDARFSVATNLSAESTSDQLFEKQTNNSIMHSRSSSDNDGSLVSSSESNSSTFFDNDLASWLYEAPELERVKLSLFSSGDNNYFARSESNLKSSSSKSKSSLSKTTKSVLRKVQRMMDQPIALRNFKDPHYAIPNLSSYQANFGMVGTMIQHRFQTTSRNQWVGRDHQQLMNRLAWDGYIRPLRGGVGIDLNYNDYQNGSIRDMSFGLTYSPKFSISRNVSFEPAVRFKMGKTDVDLNSTIIGSTIEMNRRNSLALFENGQTPLGSQLWYRDLGVGALVNTKWFYAGLNLDNVGRHYNNIYSSDLTQNYQADLDFSAVFGTEYKSLNKDMMLSTYMYYQNFGQINELWGGANVRWRNVQFGAAASTNIDLGATAGIVFDKFTVHYNLDYLKSVVLDQRMLSHQVTMRMLLKPSSGTMKLMNM